MAQPEHAQERVSAGRQGAAGLRAFARIADAWRLSVDEQLVLLGGPGRSTYYKWRKEAAPELPRDTLERLSYLLGIYKALQILFPEPVRADRWVRAPNSAAVFGGGSALQRMLGGQMADLYLVRQYLDAQLGGWPG
ncbi:MAG: MbcA/ParS/Xre antitoxin family protein [Longimicrobiales bacterium]